MLDKVSLKGEYIIEKVNKDGYREEIFRKENHLTEFTKSLLISYFSAFFNLPFYGVGAQGGGNFVASGFNRVINTSNGLEMFTNNLCLYGVNEEYEDASQFNNYPFLKDVRTVDDSKITFIGSDTTTGDMYANICPTDYLNLSVPNLISKSWKLTGPNGLGTIKTLCLGRNVHTEFTTDTSNSTMENTNPLISKILCTSYQDSNGTKNLITGMLPPIKDFNDNIFYFGLHNSNSGVFKKYDYINDIFTDVQGTDEAKSYPLSYLGCNSFMYNGNIYYTRSSSSGAFYVYNIENNTHTSFASTSSYKDGFKKGNKVILNQIIEGKYGGSNTVYVYNLDTKTQDTELFGKYNPTLSSICLNKPSWFIPRALGTRNDNENWLVLDTYKGICIECTDLKDILGTMVNWYYTNSLANTTLNGELYFLSSFVYGELLPEITASIGTLTAPSNYPMIQKATLPTDMLSIVTGVKDINGNDIVQTEDSEYIFTYNLRIE
jgi:hypothetical protein